MTEKKSKKETKISKMVLTINGKEQIIPVEAAKELYGALKELFTQESHVVHHWDWWYPKYYSHSNTLIGDGEQFKIAGIGTAVEPLTVGDAYTTKVISSVLPEDLPLNTDIEFGKYTASDNSVSLTGPLQVKE